MRRTTLRAIGHVRILRYKAAAMALSSGVGIQEVAVRIQYKKDNKSMEKVCMKVVEEVKTAVQHAEVTVDTERFEVFLGS